MGGKGGGSSESTVRWAPYVEAAHIELIENYQNYRTWALIPDTLYGIWNDDPTIVGGVASSPLRRYVDIPIDDAFFGAGLGLTSITPLYDKYDQLIDALDIESEFATVYADTVNGAVIDDLVSAEADRLADDLEVNAYPRFECGLRDINSVISSSFVIGRALMEDARTKAIARYDAEVRFRVVPLALERWKAQIDWHRLSMDQYSNILKFYIVTKEELEKHGFDIKIKNSLWPFTILEYERGAAAALAGPQSTDNEVKGASTGQQIAGGVMMGLAALMMLGA